MNYSEHLLNEICRLAALLTPISEISALLDIDEGELLDDVRTCGSPARKAYMRGVADTAGKLRRDNIDLAAAGSPAAAEACRGYLRKMIIDI